MLKKLNGWHTDQRGITGLETAIILIAFVVVASVFAYTVLSAGIFSSERGKEAVHAGLEEAQGSMSLVGSLVAEDPDDDEDVDKVVFTVANALAGIPVDLTCPTDATDDGLADAASTNVTVLSFYDKNLSYDDITWEKVALGNDDGDELLEANEKFKITAWFTATSGAVGTYHDFTVEVKPPHGSSLVIERTTPGVIDKVMILN